jgi:ribosomal RNA methyltransferase Nop2
MVARHSSRNPSRGKKQKEKKVKPTPVPKPESSSDEESFGDEMEHRKDSKGSDSDRNSVSGDDRNEEENVLVGEDEMASNPFFTDENANWLKPKGGKNKLLSSDEEESENEGDDDDDLLEVEKEAQLVDEEMEAERLEADEEMRRTVRLHTSVYHLPTTEELQRDVDRVVPPSEIRSHIESILEVLADFKTRREPGRARKEYIDQLGLFLAEIQGYLPELIEYFLTMFGPAETVEFVNASDKTRPLVIRANTLKTRRKDLAAALMKRGVTLDPLANWSKVGLKIMESPVPIGATPEYLSGMYMLQSAASMCPVLALAPEPKERVLDMSAAPGGKTSYIAQLMRNTGTIVANDLKPERQKATVANMHRLGVKNVIACAHDGRKMGVMFKNRFDRILLDAPCSGLGVISRDPSVKVQRTIADVNQCAHLQKELLLAAIDALKSKGTSGGFMVYSTCSVAVAENEEVVNYALSKRDIKIVDTGLDFGKPGFTRYMQKRFHSSVALTRRFYPHVHNMDGFFVCKIQKLSDSRPEDTLDADEIAVMKEQTTTKEGKQVLEDDRKILHKKGGKKHEKKRKLDANMEKPKRVQVSVPPRPAQPKKQQKSDTSAKMTKPRRKKAKADI